MSNQVLSLEVEKKTPDAETAVSSGRPIKDEVVIISGSITVSF